MREPISDDIRACLRFYSRLPVGRGSDAPDFSTASWAAPLAGAVVGAIGGLTLVVTRGLNIPPVVAAALAVGVLVLTTGGLHEDGLADLADGLGGGATRESKLAIMRDSRLGAYGALALCLSILARVGALAAIAERSAALGALCLVSASALSRTAGLTPMAMLPKARADGLGAAAAQPSRAAMRRAFLLAASLGLVPAIAGATLAQSVVAQMAALFAAVGIAKLAQRQIGGYTGDVLGAAQQGAEIAALIVLSAS